MSTRHLLDGVEVPGSSPLDGAMTISHTGGVLRARTEKPQARDVEREAAAPDAVSRSIPFPSLPLGRPC